MVKDYEAKKRVVIDIFSDFIEIYDVDKNGNFIGSFDEIHTSAMAAMDHLKKVIREYYVFERK